MTAPVLFAKAAQSRLVLARAHDVLEGKYNPDQKRDDHGRWTDGMPGDLVSIPIAAMGGTVTASSRNDREGIAVLSANGRSVELGRQDMRELRRQINNAKFEDEKSAGSDGVYRVVRTTGDRDSGIKQDILVSLRPVEGAYVTSNGTTVSSPDDPSVPEHEEVYNSEFDMVVGESPDGDFADEPMTRVSLDELYLSRNSVLDSLDRVAAASRVDTGNGRVDVYSPRPGAVVLRTEEVDPVPNEILLNARDVRRIDDAIGDVLFGEGEGVDDLTLRRDARTTVQTSHGPVEVRFNGRRGEDGDWSGVLTVLRPNDETWGVAVDGPSIDEFTEALDRNGRVAGIIRNSLPLHVRAVAPLFFDRVHASRRRITAHLPGEHDQDKHAGDGPNLGPLHGSPVLDADEYEEAYGDVVDERSLETDDDGMQLSVRFFDRGDAHLVIDLPEGRRQVIGEFDDSDSMRALADGIREVQHAKIPDGDVTGDIVADHNSHQHPFYVAKDDYGDVRLRDDEAGEDDYLEFGTDEAWELFDALNDLADSFDNEFGEEEDEDDDE